MGGYVDRHALRMQFWAHLLGGLRIVWPIFSGLIGMMVVLGWAIAHVEGWSVFEGVYFAFVSGLTIGYGDLVPKSALARTLAITIGFIGILLTGLVAAVGVHALHAAHRAQRQQ